MDNHVVLLVEALLVSSAAVILLGPKPSAVVAWIVSAHLDPAALAGAESNAVVAALNALRILGFPTVLWLRLGFRAGLPSGKGAWLLWLWVAFVVFVLASLAWTPPDMRLGGLKQVGYLVAYALGAAAVIGAYRRGLITATVVGAAIYAILGLAVLQTYLLGNPFGETLYEDRFVSFGSKQQFGEGLVALLALVLFVVRVPPVSQAWYVALLVGAELLNGSRVGLAGMAFVLSVWIMQPKRPERVLVGVTLSLAIVAVVGLVVSGGLRVTLLQGLRVHEVVRALESSRGLEGVGTWKARVEFWEAVKTRMAGGSSTELLFGRGVASGGKLGPRHGGDANRVFHNEYLRAIYEFGMFGGLLFGLFLLGIGVGSVALARREGSYVWLGFLPALLAFLAVENVLSGAGAAGGLGILLVLGSAACLKEPVRRGGTELLERSR